MLCTFSSLKRSLLCYKVGVSLEFGSRWTYLYLDTDKLPWDMKLGHEHMDTWFIRDRCMCMITWYMTWYTVHLHDIYKYMTLYNWWMTWLTISILHDEHDIWDMLIYHEQCNIWFIDKHIHGFYRHDKWN